VASVGCYGGAPCYLSAATRQVTTRNVEITSPEEIGAKPSP
jgi:hypothetical protein